MCLLVWCRQNKQMFYLSSARFVWRAAEEHKYTHLEISTKLYDWNSNNNWNKWASKWTNVHIHWEPTSNSPWPTFMDILCAFITNVFIFLSSILTFHALVLMNNADSWESPSVHWQWLERIWSVLYRPGARMSVLEKGAAHQGGSLFTSRRALKKERGGKQQTEGFWHLPLKKMWGLLFLLYNSVWLWFLIDKHFGRDGITLTCGCSCSFVCFQVNHLAFIQLLRR